MRTMLNVKQEKFVQNLIKGMSQRQAYKEAYNATYADKDIDNKASKLFNKDEVQTRYRELLEKLNNKSTEKAIMTAQERMEWLTGVINGAIKETYTWDGEERETTPNMITKLKALDILNKMSGEYIEKLKIGNEDENKPFEVNINVVK